MRQLFIALPIIGVQILYLFLCKQVVSLLGYCTGPCQRAGKTYSVVDNRDQQVR